MRQPKRQIRKILEGEWNFLNELAGSAMTI